ncbi:uncharacterized protein LOC143574697 [Bidens hawaiensis]|uniref:uncharacterized protein LOC143574697 n=1 Tax=Bidens hawaiensis TaxID=980011 RepID=UPI00404A90A3
MISLSLSNNCKRIIKSKSSHEEPVDSDQSSQTAEPDQPVDSENAMLIAAKPLLDCIAKYCLLAESLPSDQKQKVKNVCSKAQWWYNDNFQKHSSPNTLSTEIIHVVQIVERECKSMMRPKSSFSRHEKPVDFKKQDQTIESDLKDLSVDFENVKIEAIKALEACIAAHISHAESLPADMKDKVTKVCLETQHWLITALSKNQLSPNKLNTYVDHLRNKVERKCKSITGSKQSFQRHEEPKDSDERNQLVDSD